MKWTVLADNRTSDTSCETEHGLAVLLKTEKQRILLDTGASDLFIRNANRKDIDLSSVDYVFISHGHSDHAGGLPAFMEVNKSARIIVSPNALSRKFFSRRVGLHSITTNWPKGMDSRMIAIDQTCDVGDEIHVIANIPHVHPMPQGNRHLYVQDYNGNYIKDDFRHELALYVSGVLFTGCAHSGLENILAACDKPVKYVIGGFHLLDGLEPEEELTALAKRLREKYPYTLFFTSHCTGDKAFAIMKRVMGKQLNKLTSYKE